MYHNLLLPRQSYNLAIVLQAKNEVIGWIGIGQADEEEYGDLSFGYGLLPEHWGKGYATEALVAIIRLAFDEYTEAEKICGECDIENHASVRVMEKAGLEHVKTDGDDMIFAITRTNWARRNPA
jgi:RimJ/RimL family protein N-acetyltransferase